MVETETFLPAPAPPPLRKHAEKHDDPVLPFSSRSPLLCPANGLSNEHLVFGPYYFGTRINEVPSFRVHDLG